MFWSRRLPSVVVLVGLAGLVVAACATGLGEVEPGQKITVNMSWTGPGRLEAFDPEVNRVVSTSFVFRDAGNGGVVTVAAIPDAGAVLQSWTSGCPGSTASFCDLSFSVGPDVRLSAAATFVPDISGITFSDNFNSNCDKWDVIPLGGTADPNTNTEKCLMSGGILGTGYREMTHLFGMGTMSVEHTFTGNNLVVGRGSGEMCAATVRFEEHRIVTTAAFTGAAVGAWVWIKQDGVRYNGPTSTFNAIDDWEPYNSGPLTAADFSSGLDLCPTTASTLTFGFGRANTTNGATPITMVHGIDDWRVTIVPGPLPTP